MERIIYKIGDETIEIITEYPTVIKLESELPNGIWDKEDNPIYQNWSSLHILNGKFSWNLYPVCYNEITS